MSSGTAEVGRVEGDPLLHAVRPGIGGAVARCGAGAIAVRVPGRFDPDLEGTCPVCRGGTASPG